MELYNGVSSGTHNIYWGNYDWFIVDGWATNVDSNSKFFTKEEFMMVVYGGYYAWGNTQHGNLWGTLYIVITATNYYQLTFGSYTNGIGISNQKMWLSGMRKL